MNNSNLNEKVDCYSFFMIYKNKWNNLLSKKRRSDTKKSQRVL